MHVQLHPHCYMHVQVKPVSIVCFKMVLILFLTRSGCNTQNVILQAMED